MPGSAGSGSRGRFDAGPVISGDTAPLSAADPVGAPRWLDEVRATFAGSGPHLAWDDGDEICTAAVREGFTHVGRGIQADIRLENPAVSRRHALLHRTGDEVVVLDDHSLNGVFVGGERVEWQPLHDGDEIQIGGFCLHFIAAPHKAST